MKIIMEIWDLYDKNRKKLNKPHRRGTPLSKDEYHLAIAIIVLNSKNQFLLTLRSNDKFPNPNKWETTTGSCLMGENSLEGAKRELFEETGIDADISDFIFMDTICDHTDNYIQDTFLLRKDVDLKNLKFQLHETQNAMWADYEKVVDLAKKDKMVLSSFKRIEKVKSSVLQ